MIREVRTADKTIEDLIDEAAACLRDAGWHEAQVAKAVENAALWVARRQTHEARVSELKARYAELVSQIQRRASDG